MLRSALCAATSRRRARTTTKVLGRRASGRWAAITCVRASTCLPEASTRGSCGEKHTPTSVCRRRQTNQSSREGPRMLPGASMVPVRRARPLATSSALRLSAPYHCNIGASTSSSHSASPPSSPTCPTCPRCCSCRVAVSPVPSLSPCCSLGFAVSPLRSSSSSLSLVARWRSWCALQRRVSTRATASRAVSGEEPAERPVLLSDAPNTDSVRCCRRAARSRMARWRASISPSSR
mmetsp:Transcript_3449/g.10698  ORF Transcript_3449/g.10698 Transcript_3449/m.10698 type:complete len:235 (+) Transcript_3449:2596-3300(+)